MKTKRIIAAMAILIALVSLGAFAQVKGTLTIQCNVSGATVSANGTVIGIAAPNLTISLAEKTYSIKVTKSGYNDFVQSVNLTSAGLVLQVNLVPKGGAATVPVNVTANVPGAEIYVNGVRSGTAPAAVQLAPGSYTITVKAAGYQDYSKTVSFSSAIQFNATLVPVPVPVQPTLSVNSNVNGAEILVNGNLVGKAPANIPLMPGTYSLQVRANGFNPYTQTVTVTGNSQVSAILTPMASAVTVTANVVGADVYVNGNLVGKTPVNVQLVPGSYSLTVKAANYNDYSQGITVSGNSQVNVVLTPMQATLAVTANVNGASVLINGNVVGTAPVNVQLVPGTYNLTVRAAGFNDYVQTVQVSGSSQVNAILMASTYPISINANIGGAQVYLNGNLIGQTPMSTSLAAGSYALSVRVPGFADYNVQLNVNGPQSVSAVLASIMATWKISIPAANLYKETGKDSKDAPQGLLQVYIDGNRQKDDSGQLNAGKHVVRVVSGALMFETTIDFQAGKAYTLEPFVGLNVK